MSEMHVCSMCKKDAFLYIHILLCKYNVNLHCSEHTNYFLLYIQTYINSTIMI